MFAKAGICGPLTLIGETWVCLGQELDSLRNPYIPDIPYIATLYVRNNPYIPYIPYNRSHDQNFQRPCSAHLRQPHLSHAQLSSVQLSPAQTKSAQLFLKTTQSGAPLKCPGNPEMSRASRPDFFSGTFRGMVSNYFSQLLFREG